MKHVTEEEYNLLLNRSKITLEQAQCDQQKWIAEKEKVIKYYIKRLQKIEKNIIRSTKNLNSEQDRLIALNNSMQGKEFTFKLKKIKHSNPNIVGDSIVINPTSGEVITLSNDELKNLLTSQE